MAEFRVLLLMMEPGVVSLHLEVELVFRYPAA